MAERILVPGVAAQVEEDPAVRIPVRHAMGDVHREGGLAHASHAVDGQHASRPGGRAFGEEDLDLRGPADEVPALERQAVRCGRTGIGGGNGGLGGGGHAGEGNGRGGGRGPGGGCGCGSRRVGVLAQHQLVDFEQFGAGAQTERLRQVAPGLFVHGEGARPGAGAVQGEDVLGDHALTQGIFGHPGRELADEALVPVLGKFQVDALLGDRKSALVHAGDLGLQGGALDPREHRTGPQGQRGAELHDRVRLPPVAEMGARLRQVTAELVQVEPGLADVELVAVGDGSDDGSAGGQDIAQVGYGIADLFTRGARRRGSPDRVDETSDGCASALCGQERSEHNLMFHTSQRYCAPAHLELKRPQHPKLDFRHEVETPILHSVRMSVLSVHTTLGARGGWESGHPPRAGARP